MAPATLPKITEPEKQAIKDLIHRKSFTPAAGHDEEKVEVLEPQKRPPLTIL